MMARSKLALGENEYLRQMDIWGNGYLGKIYIRGNRHRGKWVLVQIGTKVNGHLGKRSIPNALKGYPSALCSFSPNVCKWALGQMGFWGKLTFGGKEYPQVLYAHLPQIYANGRFGQIDIWGKGYP